MLNKAPSVCPQRKLRLRIELTSSLLWVLSTHFPQSLITVVVVIVCVCVRACSPVHLATLSLCVHMCAVFILCIHSPFVCRFVFVHVKYLNAKCCLSVFTFRKERLLVLRFGCINQFRLPFNHLDLLEMLFGTRCIDEL